MPRAPSIKGLLKDLDADELREVVVQLVGLSKQNRQFVELYLQDSEKADPDGVVAAARRALEGCFMMASGRPRLPPDLRKARRIVAQHEKLLADYPRHAAEVVLAYVELGAAHATDAEATYGYTSYGFETGLLSMYERFARRVQARPTLGDTFGARMRVLAGRGELGLGVRVINTVLDRGETDPKALRRALDDDPDPPERYQVVRFRIGPPDAPD